MSTWNPTQYLRFGNERLQPALDLLSRIPLEHPAIIYDLGCGTGTVTAFLKERWPDQDITYKIQPQNRGKGAALREAFKMATGDIILIQDADLEYNPKDHPKLIRPILDGVADVVYGSRFVGGDAHRVHLFWHMVGNKFITMLSNMLTNLNLTDMENCYKVFKKEVLEGITLKANRFDFEPELTAKIAKPNQQGRLWRVFEVGISYAGRDYSEGKKITWVDGIPALWTIVKCRFTGR